MKQFVRSFSIGLFVASLIIFIFYNYFAEPEFDANDLSTDELIDLVEDDGYRVITEEEYITYTVNDEENNKKDDKDNKKKKDDKDSKKKKDDKDVEKYTLEIKSDMSSKKIAKLLEKEKIIKDASKFNKFMNKNDYSEDIEPGKFDLTSDMAEKEIAKTITDK